MNIAGKYLSLAQGAAEGALLAPLRRKYKLQLNLATLSERAKELLAEEGMQLNPSNLLKAADQLASSEATMLDDVAGIEQTRWNPSIKGYEEYIPVDPRTYFIR